MTVSSLRDAQLEDLFTGYVAFADSTSLTPEDMAAIAVAHAVAESRRLSQKRSALNRRLFNTVLVPDIAVNIQTIHRKHAL